VALAKATVAIDDLEMEDFSQNARGLSYFFNIKTAAPTDKVIKVAQFADKGCQTGNSMRKRMPVAGKIILNERVCDRRLT
jgi:hypothetical protein